MKHRTLHLATIFVTLSVTMALSQGLYVESKNSSDNDIEKFWYMPKMFRSTTDDGKIAILRLDKDVMYSIDPANKTYTEMKFSDIQARARAGRAKMEVMMKKRMNGLSPEQRKVMEDRMAAMQGSNTKPEIRDEVVSTGESKVIAGFQCTKYVIKRNGKESEIVWASKDIKGFESIRVDMEKWMTTMSTLSGSRQSASEWYNEIKGFPVQTESDGSVHTVTHLEQKTINASQFEVPAGYAKESVNLPEQLQEHE